MNDEKEQLEKITYYAEVNRLFYDQYERSIYGPLNFCCVLIRLRVIKRVDFHSVEKIWRMLSIRGTNGNNSL